MKLSPQVKSDLNELLRLNWDDWMLDVIEYSGMDLTVATNDGNQWGYQTGDNSYTGGAYGCQHWAVVTLLEDSDIGEIHAAIVSQLEELLAASYFEEDIRINGR